jgi:hypothetical protein
MKIGSLIKHNGYFGIGVVVGVMGKDRKLKISVHWMGDRQTTGWIWAYNNGMEVLCK